MAVRAASLETVDGVVVGVRSRPVAFHNVIAAALIVNWPETGATGAPVGLVLTNGNMVSRFLRLVRLRIARRPIPLRRTGSLGRRRLTLERRREVLLDVRRGPR